MVDIHDNMAGRPVIQLILADTSGLSFCLLPSAFCLLFVAIAGLALGSFLNVVIYRLPRKESIVFPGSHCPSCGASISFRDNIPCVSYLLLRGRCRHCSASISWRYPFVELLTALFAVGLYVLNDSLANFTADVALASILLAVFAIDLRHMIIPDRLNAAGALLALPLMFRWGVYGILRGMYGVLVGVIILAIMMAMGHLVFKRQGIGMGDVKLAVVIGLFLGPFWSFITFIIAVFLGGTWGVISLVRGSVRTGQEVPFGPFIALGGFCVLFFKLPILYMIEHYLSLL